LNHNLIKQRNPIGFAEEVKVDAEAIAEIKEIIAEVHKNEKLKSFSVFR